VSLAGTLAAAGAPVVPPCSRPVPTGTATWWSRSGTRHRAPGAPRSRRDGGRLHRAARRTRRAAGDRLPLDTPLRGPRDPGNLLATPDGWVWGDLEDTCAGPLEWDLACLRSTRRLDGRAALDAFPGAPADDELAPWLELRRLHGAVWGVVIDADHAGRVPDARAVLAQVLGGG